MKKLFPLAAIAFCMAFSLSSRAQATSIFFLADNIKGASTVAPGTTEVISMGTSLACGGCAVAPGLGGAGTGKAVPGKIVFNIKSDVLLNTLKASLMKGTPGGNAYFIFSKTSGINSKAGTPSSDYYYIKLTNYTVIEIDESTAEDGNTVQVSLGYSIINWTMKAVSPRDGTLGTPQSFGWDFTRNAENSSSAIPTGF